MTDKPKTIEEIVKLDSERTQGDFELEYNDDLGELTLWMGEAINNHHCYNSEESILLYDGAYEDDGDDQPSDFYERCVANSAFIAAAPRIAAKCIELDAVNKELVAALKILNEIKSPEEIHVFIETVLAKAGEV